MLYQSHDEYQHSVVNIVLNNKDFFIAMIEEDANFRAWQNANFPQDKEFPHVLNRLTTDEAMAIITPVEALKYGNKKPLYNSLLPNFDLCLKIHNWIKTNANIVNSWCEWQKQRAPSLWLPPFDNSPLRNETVVNVVLNNKDFFIAMVEENPNFREWQNTNFTPPQKFPHVLDSLTNTDAVAFATTIESLQYGNKEPLNKLLLCNSDICRRIDNWIRTNAAIVKSWCEWQKQRAPYLWLPQQPTYRQAEERQQYAPVVNYSYPQPAAYRQAEERQQQHAPVVNHPYPQPAYRPEERQQQPVPILPQIPEAHHANRPSAPQSSGKYYVVIPDSRFLDCDHFQIGNRSVYLTAQAAAKSLDNAEVRLVSPKIIEIDLPSQYEYGINNKGEVQLPENARRHRPIQVPLNNVHAWPLQKEPERAHFAFFQPEPVRAPSANSINQIKSKVIEFMQAYQENLRSTKVRTPQGKAYLRDIRLQYWPETIKDRFLVSDNILSNLQKHLTDKQLFICLQHGLAAAQRIQSTSLAKCLTTAIQDPCFAKINMQSTQTTKHNVMQQTMRSKVAAEDSTNIPKYLRCSLTGTPIKGTPITLMSGLTYDCDNILDRLKKSGYDLEMKERFKEEILANSALETTLMGVPIQEETLKNMLVVNRPLENLITKFNSNKDFEESDFCCGIMFEPYENPVLSVSGHGYSRAGLEEWLGSHQTDPQSRKVMNVLEIRPNKAMVEAMLANKELFPESNPSNASLPGRPGHG